MYRRLGLLFCALICVCVSATTSSAHDELTIGLIGDSTVATTYGWGPAIEKRFDTHTKVLHFAKNGATLDSLSDRLDVLLKLNPDYVFIQFGHNDQKRYGTDQYQEKLTSYAQRVKNAGGKAVIFSSVTRRNFGKDGKISPRHAGLKATLPDFAKTAEAVAKEQDAAFIDLYHLSVEHHNAIGPVASAAYNSDENDRTHFSPTGADAIADLIAGQLKTIDPRIAKHLVPPKSDSPAN
ncbi:Rhamnogalacturonan acetylesterase RhgT [Rubripirellula lacrimiformis]|uniref:Rhamnogalacturonan acetylesterase RhgT n=1 Tax=Rubripirellula lacrimiformis TaxID=1930273 RepID=A0A517NEH6_9BACT|nr:rhamnogalacturonan acetylesterase [Rubripirellula lacrimiformis]QDT05535.1 Rhamnogalacturonan acetylesterase RhgT [Rubripirellula lacrimiformis]